MPTSQPPLTSLMKKAGLKDVGEALNREQVDLISDLTTLKERSKHHRTIIAAWKGQQVQDREMRKLYASWLMIAMSVQIVAINVVFILIGAKVLVFEPWTANTFVMAVFAEIGALVLLVVKYLFPAPSDKILELIDLFRKETRVA